MAEMKKLYEGYIKGHTIGELVLGSAVVNDIQEKLDDGTYPELMEALLDDKFVTGLAASYGTDADHLETCMWLALNWGCYCEMYKKEHGACPQFAAQA